METRELKKIWKTLAAENLVDSKMAKEHILEIISQKGYGVMSKIQRKLQLDFNVYLAAVLFIPVGIIFVWYYNSQYNSFKTIAELGRQYIILCLVEVFMVYALVTVKRNIDFMNHTATSGSLKESLISVRSYFHSITKKGFWVGTISLMMILSFIEVDVLLRIG
ncbi:MAG: hypothetical protein AAF391_10975, partial [Bacteroidota bacterium]